MKSGPQSHLGAASRHWGIVVLMYKLEVARRYKSECKVNLSIVEIPLAAMAAGEWLRKLKLYPITTWRMDLRQLTVYEHFGWVNMQRRRRL